LAIYLLAVILQVMLMLFRLITRFTSGTEQSGLMVVSSLDIPVPVDSKVRRAM
jgi:hypothetical protein